MKKFEQVSSGHMGPSLKRQTDTIKKITSWLAVDNKIDV